MTRIINLVRTWQRVAVPLVAVAAVAAGIALLAVGDPQAPPAYAVTPNPMTFEPVGSPVTAGALVERLATAAEQDLSSAPAVSA